MCVGLDVAPHALYLLNNIPMQTIEDLKLAPEAIELINELRNPKTGIARDTCKKLNGTIHFLAQIAPMANIPPEKLLILIENLANACHFLEVLQL